jgi:diacylglycerol kinase family enzyme
VRLLFIVNASASSVTERARVVIQKALSSDHTVTVSETSRRGHATKLAQGAAADGLDAVVVLGGDGTLNEAANGLAGTSTALGVLPGGSTNVFARTLGYTNDPIEATGELLAALDSGHTVRTGLGTVNGRAFLFHVGFGYDAAVVAQVERRGRLKRYAGHALFLSAAVSTWFGDHERRRATFTLDATGADGPVPIPDGVFAVCLRTNPYTFLGDRPLDVAPGAGLDTALTAVVLHRLDLSTMLPVLGRALAGQGLDGRRNVTVARHLDAFTLCAAAPLPYQVDGDHLGSASTFDVRYEPDTLTLVVPR